MHVKTLECSSKWSQRINIRPKGHSRHPLQNERWLRFSVNYFSSVARTAHEGKSSPIKLSNDTRILILPVLVKNDTQLTIAEISSCSVLETK